MNTCLKILLMFIPKIINVPPIGSDFRITDSMEVRATDDGNSRITDAI